MTDIDELDYEYFRSKTHEYRDMRVELRKLVDEWRDPAETNRRAASWAHSRQAADTYEACADELEALPKETE